MEQAVFADLEISWESVLVPAEEDAGGDRLDVHGRRFENTTVACRVFDNLFVEHLVFAPACNGVKIREVIGVSRDVEIASYEVRGIAVLLSGLKILANNKLKKLYGIVTHAGKY